MKGIKGLLALRGRATTIRARVLAIALVPSLVLLGLGVGASGYLVNQGIEAEDWSIRMQDGITPGINFATTVQEERRLTLLRVGGDLQGSVGLDQQRQLVNGSMAQMNSLAATLTELNPGVLDSAGAQFAQVFTAIAGMRQKIDARQSSPQEVYAFYNQLVDVVSIGMQSLAKTAPDAETAAEESTGTDLFQAADAMSRGNALAAGGVARGGLTPDELLEYSRQVGTYHTMVEGLLARLTDHGRSQYAAVAGGDAWKKVSAMETALIQRTRLPSGLADWQSAASQVTTGLLDIWKDHHRSAQEVAADNGKATFWQSLLAGIGVLIVAVLAFLIALRLSTRLINRLKRLRAETLDLADERLPRIIQRLRGGERVEDLEAEVASLDHGADEIGQVADAFNKAQHTAVAAAVTEAQTREGVNAVFLNIAHRNQVVVHRQLEVLDEAERKQDDPDQLELLFKLDHLATRSRRNAENLIILGGAQPGRQWRNPVPLVEVVRSAVGETEDYARVRTGRLPAVSMVGSVVADLVHLIAELVDNATSFSPPESRVEVRGNVVGKGIVVEVEDQGLGIPKEERERINDSLHDPPDFQVMSLSGDARLGLFVVARLAARHGISVTLAESAYGGTRAIVLIRSNLIAPVGGDEEKDVETDVETTETSIFAPQQRRGSGATHRSLFEPVRQPTPEPSVNGVATSTFWPVEEPVEEPRESPARHAQPRHAQPSSVDDRPPLPRRRRQANLAPQLAGEPVEPVAEEPVDVVDDRPAEQARDMMAAFQRGTRQARDGE